MFENYLMEENLIIKTWLIQLFLWKYLYFASCSHMQGSILVEIFSMPWGEQEGLSAGAQEGFLGWAELRAQGVQCLAKELLCCRGSGQPGDV